MLNIESFNNQANKYIGFLDNDYVKGALAIFLVSSIGTTTHYFSSHMMLLTDNKLFVLLVYFLLAYILTRNAFASILVALCLWVLLIVIGEKYHLNEPMAMMQHQHELNKKYKKMGYDCKLACNRNSDDDEQGNGQEYEQEYEHNVQHMQDTQDMHNMQNMQNMENMKNMQDNMSNNNYNQWDNNNQFIMEPTVLPMGQGNTWGNVQTRQHSTRGTDSGTCFTKFSLSNLQETYKPHLTVGTDPSSYEPSSVTYADAAQLQ